MTAARNFLRQIGRNRLARLGAVILLIVVIAAVLAPLVLPGDPNLIRPRLKNLPSSFAHPFGTDQLGRDLFLRVMHGARLSFGIALAVSLITLVVGSLIGVVAGYFEGWTDAVLSRILDSLMAFPSILLALGIMAALGASLYNVILALSLVYMPRVARVARAPVLSEKRLEYVEAARSCGASHLRVLFRHILPNVLSPIIVQVTVVFAYAMVAEATLGFLGVGVPPPEPTWGNLLADGRRTLMVAPAQTIFPAVALGLTVLGINLFGDGLRDILDPRMRGIRVGDACMSPGALLEVVDLRTYFEIEGGVIRAVDGVTFHLDPGETLGVVGESGSGKSVLSRSILRLVQTPPGRYAGGVVKFAGEDLFAKSEAEMRAIRGNRISMIFQEPLTSLNPVLTIGFQIAETLRLHRGLGRTEARRRTIEMLRRVRIASPERRVDEYPHQLSGGMRQRAMIAMALACGPELLIADEPTTALDVTIQAQILALMDELKSSSGMSMILITHNLGIVADIADRVMVMYAGTVVETAPVDRIFDNPQHPYTIGLLGSVPGLEERRHRLSAIAENIPSLSRLPTGCRFHPRCPRAMPICAAEDPPVISSEPGHEAKCWLLAEAGRPTE